MRKALGKGLSQLLGEQLETGSSELLISNISPNQRQPRRIFDEDALKDLSESIKVHGVLQPILVRPISEGKYEIIAGERRWRASQLAGLKTMPVMIKSAAGQDSLEWALIENVQREDISAAEQAVAFRRLMDEFGLTQEQVADRVGKSRTAVANTVRLLRLPKAVLSALELGKLSEGHARALLAFETEEKKLSVFNQILEKDLTVRDVEKLAQDGQQPKTKTISTRVTKDVFTIQLESALSEKFGTPAKLDRTEKGGKVVLEFYSDEDLERIIELLGVQI